MREQSVYYPIEPLMDKAKSLYKLVVLAARRSLELNEGAPKFVEVDPKIKPSTIALEEIAAGKIELKEKGKKKDKKEA
tara:strand:+ start:35 stop:268 length:234 start_codon:yes stop_codon:yes gene_type:complete